MAAVQTTMAAVQTTATPATMAAVSTMMPPANTSMTANTMAMPAPEVEAQLKIVQLQYYFNQACTKIINYQVIDLLLE